MSKRVTIQIEITEHEHARLERFVVARRPEGDPPLDTPELVARCILRRWLPTFEAERSSLDLVPANQPPLPFAPAA